MVLVLRRKLLASETHRSHFTRASDNLDDRPEPTRTIAPDAIETTRHVVIADVDRLERDNVYAVVERVAARGHGVLKCFLFE